MLRTGQTCCARVYKNQHFEGSIQVPWYFLKPEILRFACISSDSERRTGHRFMLVYSMLNRRMPYLHRHLIYQIADAVTPTVAAIMAETKRLTKILPERIELA